ncbi:MAG TPA: hypothetical protein VFJ64_07315 [Solirubrobacterales bacterium]|nr:hypothetical protein [Solirubrobacterales bacterium]
MRVARHPASSLLATGMLAVALMATLASGCGSSGTKNSSGEGSTKTTAPPGAAVLACTGASGGVGTLRASGVGCATGRQVAAGWTARDACGTNSGTSRTSCTVAGYRCLGIATERGLAVSCARPGRSISFVAKRR